MIYADHAATTRLSQTAFDAASEFLFDEYGNSSSRYSLGVRAKRALDAARERVARLIGARREEIFFTSGGSEGNSWVLSLANENVDSRLIVSAFEHPSVHQNAMAFQRHGGDVFYVPIERSGVVSLDAYRQALREKNASLVSIMSVNNEIGSIQPIEETTKLAHEHGALVHVDAVQALGKIPIDVKKLDVDFLTASAHKFNGPKGVGFLYKRCGVELPVLVRGGGQEFGLRSGTENVFGAVAASYALEENVGRLRENEQKQRVLYRKTIDALRSEIDENDFQIAGDEQLRAPGTFDVLFKNADGEALTILLDMKKICVSTGSACDSINKEPSRILTALGYSPEEAISAVRISYGWENTEEEAEQVGKTLAFAYKKLRRS